MNAAAFRETIARMYCNLGYDAFCEYMQFNPNYADKYWDAFQELAAGIAVFDNERLQKILDFQSIVYGTKLDAP